jgi:hypothetical protein
LQSKDEHTLVAASAFHRHIYSGVSFERPLKGSIRGRPERQELAGRRSAPA